MREPAGKQGVYCSVYGNIKFEQSEKSMISKANQYSLIKEHCLDDRYYYTLLYNTTARSYSLCRTITMDANPRTFSYYGWSTYTDGNNSTYYMTCSCVT